MNRDSGEVGAGRVKVRPLPRGEGAETLRDGATRCVRVPAPDAEWLLRETKARFVLVERGLAYWPGGALAGPGYVLAALRDAARGELVFVEEPDPDAPGWLLHEVSG